LELSRRPPPLFELRRARVGQGRAIAKRRRGLHEVAHHFTTLVVGDVFLHGASRQGRSNRRILGRNSANDANEDQASLAGRLNRKNSSPSNKLLGYFHKVPAVASLWRGLDRHGRAVARRAEAASGTIPFFKGALPIDLLSIAEKLAGRLLGGLLR
jgi:hypothetical protein